jgi:hypothetical protein
MDEKLQEKPKKFVPYLVAAALVLMGAACVFL